MKRFFTFLMAVWALLSISQTVKAADYCIMSSFVEGQDVGGSSSTETGAKYYLVGSMNNWGTIEATSKNYPFTTTDNVTYTCTLSGQSGTLYFKPKSSAGGTWLAPGASDAYITTEYQSTTDGNGAWMLEASSDKTYTITLDCSNAATPKIKYSEQGSGSVTPPTPLTNPIDNRIYSEGYYLVGNFFNFDGPTINYYDAVFKFKQQKDDAEGNAVYMLEIPATLTARAQVMSVDATRNPVAVYGPGRVLAINNSTLPVGEDNQTATTGIQNLTPSTEIVDDGTNCWDMTTRRTKSDGVGQDGSYKYYITVDKATGEPSKWEIKYTDLKRVAFLLSTNPLGSALTVGSTRAKNTFEGHNDQNQANFNSGKYFGSLYMDNHDEYYGVSNDLAGNNSLSSSYGYEAIKNDIDRPTYNKLFLFGNGGLDITQSDEAKKAAANWGTFKCPATSGVYVLEFNTNKGNGNNEAAHGGTGAEILKVPNREVITTLSMVG